MSVTSTAHSSGKSDSSRICVHELDGQPGFLVPEQLMVRAEMGTLDLCSGQLVIGDLSLLEEVAEYANGSCSAQALDYYGAGASSEQALAVDAFQSNHLSAGESILYRHSCTLEAGKYRANILLGFELRLGMPSDPDAPVTRRELGGVNSATGMLLFTDAKAFWHWFMPPRVPAQGWNELYCDQDEEVHFRHLSDGSLQWLPEAASESQGILVYAEEDRFSVWGQYQEEKLLAIEVCYCKPIPFAGKCFLNLEPNRYRVFYERLRKKKA